MRKKYSFTSKNLKSGKIETVGYMELNNSPGTPCLRFYGDIVSDIWGRWVEEDKCPQDVVDFLGEIDSEMPLDIFINSGGGSVGGGMAIYNILNRHKGYKTVYVDGIAASIASVIAFGGDRIIMPSGTLMMLHKPALTITGGNADELRRNADALDVCQKSMVGVYMQHVRKGITEEQIIDMMEKETWLTGRQAAQCFNVEALDGGEAAACLSACFDLYRNMPKDAKTGDPGDIDRASKILADLDYI